jgi:hypothetical protein
MPAAAGARERHEPRGAGILGASVAAALLFSVALLVPVLFLIAAVSPFPLIVQRLKRSLGSALAAALLSAALLAGAFSAGQALTFLLVLALPGLLIGEAMARGRGMLKGCGWAFTLLASEICAGLVFAGPRLADQVVLEPLAQYRSPQFLEEMRSTGLPPERVDDWAEQFAMLQRAMEVVYPAAFLILGALVVLANAGLLRAYLVRRDPGWLEGGEFEGIRWPFGMALAFVASGALVVVPALRAAGYNLLLLVAFFFALQGLAVVAYYAHRLAGPPLLRAVVLLLVLVNPWAPQILALLGLFDTWFDFRKWAQIPPAGGR